MTKTTILAIALLGSPWVAQAHHSFASFDMGQHKTIGGTVRTLEWSNPHVWLWVDVAAAGRTVTHYAFEARGPGELGRSGWNKHSVNPGDKVTVTFAPLRTGEPGGSMEEVLDAAGKRIGKLGGPPGGGPPGGPGGGGPPGGPGGGPPGGPGSGPTRAPPTP